MKVSITWWRSMMVKFGHLYRELQLALLMLAGAGKQGFIAWQAANMTGQMNKVITDIFTLTLDYVCSLPQGNKFSVEIANLYAWLILMWWNMDPLNPDGNIADNLAPRNAYPLLVDEV